MTASDPGPRLACICSNPRRLTIGTREGQLVRVCGLCWKRCSPVE